MSQTIQLTLSEAVAALAASTLTVEQVESNGCLTNRQREQLIAGIIAKAASDATLADATLDRDDDVLAIQAVQAEIAAQTVTLDGTLTTILGAVDDLEDLSQDQIDELQNILAELQTQSSELSDIGDSLDTANAHLLDINGATQGILLDLAQFRAENQAALADVNTELDNLLVATNAIATAVQNLFDYEEQLGIADNDGRLIVRSTWINKTTGVKTVQYYEQDGVTTTTDVFDDVQDVEYNTTVSRWRTPADGSTTDYFLHTVFAIEDGVTSLVSSSWRDAFGAVIPFVPAALVPFEESTSSSQITTYHLLQSTTDPTDYPLSALVTGDIIGITLTVVTANQPITVGDIRISDFVGGFFNFKAVNETKNMETIGDRTRLALNSLQMNGTPAAGDFQVRVTIHSKP